MSILSNHSQTIPPKQHTNDYPSGLLTYTTLNTLIYLTKLASRGRFIPEDADNAEYWSPKTHMGRFLEFVRSRMWCWGGSCRGERVDDEDEAEAAGIEGVKGGMRIRLGERREVVG